MLNIETSAQDLARLQNWFPFEIERDPWIVYHGTSSTAENFIDQHGFRCGSTDLNDAALLCLTIMETIDFWAGPYGALKAYSLPRIREAGTPPFFCALYPQRTGLYTKNCLLVAKRHTPSEASFPNLSKYASKRRATLRGDSRPIALNAFRRLRGSCL